MKKLTSKEIRSMFLNYFKEKGHTIIESASLIPNDDPTLLWNNAGVTPLKKFFDGSIVPENKRLVSSQKCLRTNDIEIVGDNTHHTFFEMLGNFSIGDYFKKEAIEMSYDLLVNNFLFDPSKLYVTIFPNDIEAHDMWVKVGIKEDHIIKLEGNFWEIGEGPCGPDSEIFYDRGIKYDPDNIGIKLLTDEIDNSRYVEIWNNVFSQYNSKEGVKREDYKELPSKNIDTGMGLERMTTVINEVDSTYDTDLFIPIINKIEELSNKKYNNYKREFRIIADHIRALTFSVSDGAVFSNEGRGYVIRRLLRRASRYGKKLGINDNFLYNLVDTVTDIMGDAYPKLLNNVNNIKDLILKEEVLFSKTLISGEKKLVELMENSKDKTISGESAFKLYDTYGFPFELTLEYLEENGFSVSKDEFNKFMNIQREMARSSRINEISMNIQNAALLNFKDESTFVGYDNYECDAKVIGLFLNDSSVNSIDKEGYVILDKTPFYAEMGGQVGDTGYIYNDNCKLEVIETIKAPNKQHLHIVNVIDGILNINDTVKAKIDSRRRDLINKNHSAAHLLQEALREVLGSEIHQAGSRVDNNTLRFDFMYTKKVTDEDLIKIEDLVNNKINTKVDTNTKETDLESAKKMGAIALFDEKYGDIVRVVTINTSIELCGGTHVKNIYNINSFAIKSFESKGSNLFRIEATTDTNISNELFDAIKPYNDEMIKLLEKAKRIVIEAGLEDITLDFDININNDSPKSYKDVIFNRDEIVMVRKKISELEEEYFKEKAKKILDNISDFDKYIVKNDTYSYIITSITGYGSVLKQIVDELTNKVDFVFLANVNGNNVNYISKCNKNLSDKINCGELIKNASIKSSGNGGGSNTYGSGGGTDITKIDEILDNIKIVVNSLK